MTSQYFEVIGWVITGGVVTALINNIGDLVMWVMGRKATLSDKRNDLDDRTNKTIENIETLETKLTETDKTLHGVVEGMRLILYDRIKFIGTGYINHKSVNFEDRVTLNRMTSLYKDTLHGDNSVDLDMLMDEINHLPLSHKSTSDPHHKA